MSATGSTFSKSPGNALKSVLGSACTVAVAVALCVAVLARTTPRPQTANASAPPLSNPVPIDRIIDQMQAGQLAPPKQTPAQANAQALAQLSEVSRILRDYSQKFSEFPTGDNPEITRALMGKNPQKIQFLIAGELPLDQQGALLDYWHTPYFFHQLSGTRMQVRSAGPDQKMYTDDDLTVFPR